MQPTLSRFFICVHADVFDQIRKLYEGLGAELAPERFLTPVRLTMEGQTVMRSKGFGAQLTPVRFFVARLC